MFFIMFHKYLKLFYYTAKSLQSCPTLCDHRDGSPRGSPVPGILQARTLEWVAISFSNAWKWKMKVKSFSRVRLLATSWTAAHQAPPTMGFSRQQCWSGVPLPSPILLHRTLKLERLGEEEEVVRQKQSYTILPQVVSSGVSGSWKRALCQKTGRFLRNKSIVFGDLLVCYFSCFIWTDNVGFL